MHSSNSNAFMPLNLSRSPKARCYLTIAVYICIAYKALEFGSHIHGMIKRENLSPAPFFLSLESLRVKINIQSTYYLEEQRMFVF